MNVVIDIGNTAAKLAVFKKHKLLWIYHAGQPIDLRTFEKQKFELSDSIVSSVVKLPEEKQLFKLLTDNTSLTRFTHKTPLPFINRYKTPATLGLDRLAAVAGAWKRFPNKNVLVIDAGTCVKYDFINAKGQYLGGSISPGLQMRFDAMHNFTNRLPLIRPEEIKSLTGDSTNNSMLTGAILGIINEIGGFIALYKSKYKNLKVILTGGDAEFLGRQLRTLKVFPTSLKNSIFAAYLMVLTSAPYLTLEGLNEILLHNIKIKKGH